MLKIINAEPDGYNPQAMAMLQSMGTVFDGPFTRDALISAIIDADVLVVRLGHSVDAELLARANNLRAVVTATTGLNHIDLDAAKAKGVAVLSLKGETAFLQTVHATAELTLTLILALQRRLIPAVRDVLSGAWDRDRFKGYELAGQTLGIIGYGRLGKKVAGYASALGMKILAYDVRSEVVFAPAQFVELDDVLRQSDIVSLHVPYGPDTHHLAGAAFFSKMRRGASFINTSRGECVDEAALLAGLKSGQLGGAGLDVLCAENDGTLQDLADNGLIGYANQHPNLIITPHIGGATVQSMYKTELFMAEKLCRWINKE